MGDAGLGRRGKGYMCSRIVFDTLKQAACSRDLTLVSGAAC